MSYLRTRYHIKGLYLLDEPESALSPSSQIEFVKLLRWLAGGGHAQFVLATHSPILLACPEAQIFSFDSTGIREVQYENTDHFRLYKQFLADRAAFLGD